jgi:hypothetical protein
MTILYNSYFEDKKKVLMYLINWKKEGNLKTKKGQ